MALWRTALERQQTFFRCSILAGDRFPHHRRVQSWPREFCRDHGDETLEAEMSGFIIDGWRGRRTINGLDQCHRFGTFSCTNDLARSFIEIDSFLVPVIHDYFAVLIFVSFGSRYPRYRRQRFLRQECTYSRSGTMFDLSRSREKISIVPVPLTSLLVREINRCYLFSCFCASINSRYLR